MAPMVMFCVIIRGIWWHIWDSSTTRRFLEIWFSCCSSIYFRSILFKRRANLSGSKDLKEAMYTTLLLFQQIIGKVSMLFGLLYAVHSDHNPFFAAIGPQWKYICVTYFCRPQLLIKYCQFKNMWKADKKVWSSYPWIYDH